MWFVFSVSFTFLVVWRDGVCLQYSLYVVIYVYGVVCSFDGDDVICFSMGFRWVVLFQYYVWMMQLGFLDVFSLFDGSFSFCFLQVLLSILNFWYVVGVWLVVGCQYCVEEVNFFIVVWMCVQYFVSDVMLACSSMYVYGYWCGMMCSQGFFA